MSENLLYCVSSECDGQDVELEKREYKSGGTYYRCPKCNHFYAVMKDGSIRIKRRGTCPLCGGEVNEGFAKETENSYHRCKNCETYFDLEENGEYIRRPALQRPEASCPKCGGKALQFKRKDGSGVFWKCQDCQEFFNDEDGRPVPQKR